MPNPSLCELELTSLYEFELKNLYKLELTSLIELSSTGVASLYELSRAFAKYNEPNPSSKNLTSESSSSDRAHELINKPSSSLVYLGSTRLTYTPNAYIWSIKLA
ncbi:hypothetical protein CRG98_011742 [Punica granatum]|uniref:Uncharacterized protein n=1 Tax=Punica granatum TaxID=22663 RepID=A0A2I0KI34_PUNGR|nr:hypothetical protein CRG98_011742 [Punica granatum]